MTNSQEEVAAHSSINRIGPHFPSQPRSFAQAAGTEPVLGLPVKPAGASALIWLGGIPLAPGKGLGGSSSVAQLPSPAPLRPSLPLFTIGTGDRAQNAKVTCPTSAKKTWQALKISRLGAGESEIRLRVGVGIKVKTGSPGIPEVPAHQPAGSFFPTKNVYTDYPLAPN